MQLHILREIWALGEMVDLTMEEHFVKGGSKSEASTVLDQKKHEFEDILKDNKTFF